MPPEDPSEAVIEALERFLEAARRGEVRSVAIAAVMRNGHDGSDRVNAEDAHAMRLYAGVNLLRARLEGPLVAAAERGAA